jgi:hypothetical protein
MLNIYVLHLEDFFQSKHIQKNQNINQMWWMQTISMTA